MDRVDRMVRELDGDEGALSRKRVRCLSRKEQLPQLLQLTI